ncbi:MAG TPA: hypothetical protein PLX97_14465 [Gemmatales bacterium]|nr:hypothetical protein [Gemmatales bacterium]
MSHESPPTPPARVSGKSIVLILIPVILISFAWLAYARVTFTHPTNLPTALTSRPTP